MNRQTQHQRAQYTEVMERKRLAARARMPDALKEVSDYAKRCAAFLSGEGSRLPEEPRQAIEDLKVAIEHIDTPQAMMVYDLIAHYQVHNSRLPNTRLPKFKDFYYDTALLHCLADRLYGYARPDDMRLNRDISSEQVVSSFKLTFRDYYRKLSEDGFNDLKADFSRRHGDG